MTVVLALDLASSTGVAWDAPGGGRPFCSTWRAPTAEAKDYGRRFDEYHCWLSEVIVTVRPGLLGFEAPLVRSDRAARFLIGLASITEMTAAHHAVPCVEEHVATIKQFFGGSGRATKDAMMGRCRQLGWAVRNDDEADAAALWTYLKSMSDPKFSFQVTPLGTRL